MSDPQSPMSNWAQKLIFKELSHFYDSEKLPAKIDLNFSMPDAHDLIHTTPAIGMTMMLDELVKVLLQAEPITVDTLIADAKEQGYTEGYGVFRYRERAIPDRLPEVMLTAPSLDAAVQKLLKIAGYDTPEEIELLGLDQFNAGNIMELCDRLTELTGDRHIVCPYEIPTETN